MRQALLGRLAGYSVHLPITQLQQELLSNGETFQKSKEPVLARPVEDVLWEVAKSGFERPWSDWKIT